MFAQEKWILWTVVIVGLFVGALLFGGSAEAAKVSAAKDDKITALLQERLALAHKIHDLAFKRFQAGHATGSQVLGAKTSLLQIQLELGKTREQRLKVYDDMLRMAAEWKRVTKEHETALGESATLDALQATAFRLEIQTALEKAKLVK